MHDDAKERVREATDVVDLVSRYTDLQPAGKRMKGLSPFKQEKTPSFFVDPDTGMYYCFSTNQGGDIFKFVQEVEGISFLEALKMLAERAGIDIGRRGSKSAGDKNTKLYHILEASASVYRNHLTDGVRQYLSRRGITAEMVEQWGIGYAPDRWDTLCTPKTPSLDGYVQTGMCIRKDSHVYDRFRDRIMFPFYDTNNRVIGFSGRDYGGETGAKYINSPESPLFSKSSFLYGLHLAKNHIRKHNFSILTEGPIDAIMVHKAGFPVAVATSGTAVTIGHIRLLRRFSRRLVIAFDGDAAGTRATLAVMGMALSEGMDVKVVVAPAGTDPAEMIAKDAASFKAAVKKAAPFVPYIHAYIRKAYGTQKEDILRGAREEMLPIIAKIQDPLIRDYAIGETAEICSVSRDIISEQVDGMQRDARQPRRVRKAPVSKHAPSPVAQLLASVAYARTFLMSRGVPFDEDMKKAVEDIQTHERIPDVDESVARIRYEERGGDDKEKNDAAIRELMDASDQVLKELKKREEIKRIKGE